MTSEPGKRLDSWKEIADYLGRDLSTVRRWEDEKGLPVHRVPGGKRQAVFAFASEIDAWLREGAHEEGSGAGDRGPGTETLESRDSAVESREPEELGLYSRGSPAPERQVLIFPQPVAEAAAAPVPRLPAAGSETARPRHVRWWGPAGVVTLAGAALLALWLRPTLPPPKVLSYGEISKGIKADGASGGIVTDGPRLYFNREQKGIVEVSAGGGETAPLPVPLQGAAVMDISPSGGELLLSTSSSTVSHSGYPLWILPLPGGSPHRLGNVLAHGAAWSPDGREIVFAQGKGLYLTDNEGTQIRELIALPGWPWSPRWSPDGRALRFTLQDGRQFRLWEVSANGTNPHPLIPGWSRCTGRSELGNWTPDGAYYIFECSFGGKGELWARREKRDSLSRDVREPVRLTPGPMSWWDPVPSRDGKRIFAVGRVDRAELVRYDSRSEQFIPYLSGMSADMLDFSRDGNWLTYVEYPERTLWRSKLDGSEKLQLTLPPNGAAYPRWSPDGHWIAYSVDSGGRLKIQVIRTEGGAPVEVAPGESNQAHPSWSPDGNVLAFAGAPWVENFVPASTAVHLLHLKSRQIETLPSSQGLWSPRWSPDGRYIAALTADSRRVMMFDFAAKTWAEVASGLYVDYTCWSHDGKHLYFTTFSNEGDPALYRIELSHPRLERVLSLQGVWLAQTVGLWFGLAPDDSPLFLRNRAEGAVYALDMQWP